MHEITVYKHYNDIELNTFDTAENINDFIRRKNANSVKYFQDNLDELKNRLNKDDLYNFCDVATWAQEYSSSYFIDKMINNYFLSLLQEKSSSSYNNIYDIKGNYIMNIISLRSEMINYFAYDIIIHNEVTLDDNDLPIYNDIISVLIQNNIDAIIDEYSIAYCKLLGDIDPEIISKVRRLFKKEFLFSNEGGEFLYNLKEEYFNKDSEEFKQREDKE